MSRLGVVAALEAEARALTSARIGRSRMHRVLADGSLLAVSGMGLAAAARTSEALADAGCTALVSFGLAGGLDPGLHAGALLVPRAVLGADGRRYPAPEDWRGQLVARLQTFCPVVQGELYSSDQPLARVADKARLHTATGAVAVDMEGAAVAGVAARLGLPFIAVRVVVDTYCDELPATVAAAAAGGPLQAGRLLAGLARRPRELLALLKLARRYRRAMRTLRLVGRSGILRLPATAERAGD